MYYTYEVNSAISDHTRRNLMHQIHRLITVAQLHVCRRVLLDVGGIVRIFEVFVQLLGLKLAL